MSDFDGLKEVSPIMIVIASVPSRKYVDKVF